MGREYPGFRDNLEVINTMFPDGGILNLDQIRAFTSIKDARTIEKEFGYCMTGTTISKANLARHYAMPRTDRESLQRSYAIKSKKH